MTIREETGTGRIEEIGLAVSESTIRTFRIHPHEPKKAVLETQVTCSFGRGEWNAETRVHGQITAKDGEMLIRRELRAKEGERRVFAREWRESAPTR